MDLSDRAHRATTALVRADKAATHALAAHRDTPAMKLAGALSELGDQPPLIALSLGTLGAGLLLRRRDLARGGTRMLLSHALATGVKTVLKNRIDRSRPRHALSGEGTRFAPGDDDDHEMTSFPSGHTAGAVAVARAAAHEIDGVALPAGLATVAIAAAQAPSGHHYLLDTAAGAAIGWAAEALVGAGFERVWPSPPAGRI